MDINTIKALMTVLIFSRISHQLTPEDRCAVSESGSVCMDCFRSGTCVPNGDGTFTVEYNFRCPEFGTPPRQSYCDDTIAANSQNFGACSPLPVSISNCSCHSSSQCIADVNNPAVILHCEVDSPVTDPPCSAPILDLTTCSCASCTDSCPLLDDPDDDCANYYFCSGTELIMNACPDNLCFDQEACMCVPATEPPTIPPTCPPGCPFLDDPNDNCHSYFVCTGTELTPLNCSDTLCFDEESCGCVPMGEPTTTTTPPSTIPPPTCPPGCPFVDNPDDNCRSYFVCTETELTPINCSDTLCFDQESCGCVPAIESTTIPPTCPPGCPFLDDPNDNCKSYFVCTGNGLTPVNCSDNLCFDQESCSCVPATESTTIPPTCPSGCIFLDDPNDNCQSYFVCIGDDLVPANCSSGLCFDQESCGCVLTTNPTLISSSSISPSTISPSPISSSTISPSNCSQECPFLDNPDDNCQSYFVCTQNGLTPLSCSDNLCFDQESCSCVPATEPTIPSTCPPGCPFVDDPTDNCQSYFLCSGTGLIQLNCSDTLCFDQDLCGCVESGQPSTALPTCSEECPFLDDPNDDCLSYFLCSGTSLIQLYCSDTLCFDQELCGCVESGQPSTALPTCSEECPFLDDPNDNCASYFLCSGTGLISLSCADDLCFDQTSCGCVGVEESLPDPSKIDTILLPIPTIRVTCPPGCPFIDDPYDVCGKYYFCEEGYLTSQQCPEALCFDQLTCQCQ